MLKAASPPAHASGGQQSLWRAAFGLWLAFVFAGEVWPVEGALRPIGTLGLLLAIAFALGWRTHAAALGLLVLWWLRPLPPDPWRLDWIVLLLLALEFCVPAAPFGALDARGRADPGTDWRMPGWIPRLRICALFACAIFVAFPRNGFLLDAGRALELEGMYDGLVLPCVLCGLGALVLTGRALSRWWLVFLAGALYVAFEEGKHGSRAYLWLALAASFQPGWIPRLRPEATEWLFYDGSCGLCHGLVRFVVAEDEGGRAFRFAPLQSEHFTREVSAAERLRAGDSVVVRTADGRALVRSAVLVHLLQRLGGVWRLLGLVLWLVPMPLRDLGYALVAATRKRFFGTRVETCPMLPRHLRMRCES